MSRGVHQVLATLGYGDAIGHEVLGIQRVLQRAGYESEIFVETADRRLESLTTRLPRAGRLEPARQPAAPPLLDRVPKASRTAYALPDRMALIYHNITPPEYFVGVHQHAGEAVLPRPARADGVRGSLRPRARATPSSTGRSSRRSASRAPTCCRSCPTSRISIVAPNTLVAADFDDEWTNILFVGRVIANKKIEDSSASSTPITRVFNPRSRLLLVGVVQRLRALFRGAASAGRDGWACARAFHRPRLERGAGRLLRSRRPVPLRQRARRLLRAAGRSVLQAGAGARLRRDRGARRRWTAPACCIDDKDPIHVARADGRDRLAMPTSAGRGSSTAS